jgi:hypothetical protein
MMPPPRRTLVATTKASTVWHESSPSLVRRAPATRDIAWPMVTGRTPRPQDVVDPGAAGFTQVDLGEDGSRHSDGYPDSGGSRQHGPHPPGAKRIGLSIGEYLKRPCVEHQRGHRL